MDHNFLVGLRDVALIAFACFTFWMFYQSGYRDGYEQSKKDAVRKREEEWKIEAANH